MWVHDYLAYVKSVVSEDALFVASHTANSNAIVALGLTGRSLQGFNMGFASPIGLGLALALPHRRVITLDGDGGVLLLAAALADLGAHRPPNLTVIVADNASSLAFPSHTARGADLEKMAQGAGIQWTRTVRT